MMWRVVHGFTTSSLCIALLGMASIVDGLCIPAVGCPSECDCKQIDGRLVVDCSDRQLTAIPGELPADSVHVLLNKNAFGTLPGDAFQACQQLRTLDLSHNQINTLPANIFVSTVGLEELYLNDNSLSYNRIPQHLFNHLKNLRTLHIHNNIWQNLTAYPSNVFNELSSVEVFALDGFAGVMFDVWFASMERLRSLCVYGGLQIVHNDTFAAFNRSNVTELAIKTGLFLYEIESAGFSHFRRLVTLDLGYNQGLGFHNVSNAWWGLQFTSIKTLVLTRIMGLDDSAVYLTETFFKFPQNVRIENLMIDRNNIVEMEPLLSVAFPGLIRLDMSYNRIASISKLVKDILFLVKLKYWDCSHQAKQYADEVGQMNSPKKTNHLLKSKGTLITLNRIQNKTSKNDNAHICQTDDFLPCTTHHKFTPLRGTWCFPLPPMLEVLNITKSLNVEVDSLPAIVAIGGRLKIVEFRNNGIRSLDMPLILSSPVKLSIDLSDNVLSCLSPGFFKYAKQTGSSFTSFFLSGNSLAAQLERDVDGRTFQFYEDLVELSLDRNGIKSLPFNIFVNVSRVERLNLSGNSLRLLEFEFGHMARLAELDLSNNLLTTLTPDVTGKLSGMFTNGSLNGQNVSINLAGNPLLCSCDTLPFLSWVHANRDHLAHLEQYSCWYNGSYIQFGRLADDILVPLSFECSRRLAVIVSAVLCGLALVLVAVSVCLYRYRWEVRYWCLWLTKRSKLYNELVDDTVYDYDAFVVYAADDGPWVRNQLLPNIESVAEGGADNDHDGRLEQEGRLLQEASVSRSFRLCVHERDFMIGDNILDNIWTKMSRSCKVILVITPSFVESHYCDYEMNLARVQSVEKGRNLFVPIILEPIDIEAMSDGLHWIVRKLTYIEWPAEEHREADRIEFWQKLRDALADSGLSFNFRAN